MSFYILVAFLAAVALAALTTLAQFHVWGAVVPLSVVYVAAAVVWVGNILADRIEDHEHRRR